MDSFKDIMLLLFMLPVFTILLLVTFPTFAASKKWRIPLNIILISALAIFSVSSTIDKIYTRYVNDNPIYEWKTVTEIEYTSEVKEKATVYVTNTGECYHASDCYHLKSRIPMSKTTAISKGYRPCSSCGGVDYTVNEISRPVTRRYNEVVDRRGEVLAASLGWGIPIGIAWALFVTVFIEKKIMKKPSLQEKVK